MSIIDCDHCEKLVHLGVCESTDLALVRSDEEAPYLSRRMFLGVGAAAAAGAAAALAPGKVLAQSTHFTQASEATTALRIAQEQREQGNSWYTQGNGQSPQAMKGPPIPKWPQMDEVRQVWLRRKTTGETVVARYYDGRNLVRDQYLACCKVLRDVQASSVANIDLELLDLVFSMQKWLVEWGIDRPLIVNSGYRTPATNRKEGGKRNSMHLQGRALDFAIEGIPAEYMGRLASIFGVGGVGFYIGKNGFTHIDTGNVRFWTQRRWN